MEGTPISGTDVNISFEWKKGINTDKFVLNIKNLDSDKSYEIETENTKADAIIETGKPYSWYVESISTSIMDTAISEEWKFYSAEEGAEAHPPFPAEIIKPAFAQVLDKENTADLLWNGNDVDNDIIGYKIYFGSTNPPLFFEEVGNVNQLEISVNSNTIYYWQIETMDSHNNSSYSIVSQFKVME